MTVIDSHDVIDRCVAAYNAQNLEDFCRFVSEDVKLMDLDSGAVLLEGVKAYRELYGQMFAKNPNNRVEIMKRVVFGNHVCDEEFITGRSGGDIRALVIYTLDEGSSISRIQVSKIEK